MQLEMNNKITNKNYSYTWRLNNMLLNDALITEDIREEIKKFLEVNENNDTTYQNFWDTLKAVLRGKFIALSSYIKKIKSEQLNDLTLHLKALEKEEQINTKSSKRQEIIKIRAEINEIETRETIQKIDKTKSWFFEKVNKIDKPIATLMNRRREKIQITRIHDGKRKIMTDTIEIHDVIKLLLKSIFQKTRNYQRH